MDEECAKKIPEKGIEADGAVDVADIPLEQRLGPWWTRSVGSVSNENPTPNSEIYSGSLFTFHGKLFFGIPKIQGHKNNFQS